MQSLEHYYSACRTTLETGGVRAALMYLNSLTDYRFTALYMFRGDTLSNQYFFDRDNPYDESRPADAPVLATYCAFVRDPGGPHVVTDAAQDARLEGHPQRKAVRAYCGVPIHDEFGFLVGSLCHFDVLPVHVPARETGTGLLEAVAPLFAAPLQALQS